MSSDGDNRIAAQRAYKARRKSVLATPHLRHRGGKIDVLGTILNQRPCEAAEIARQMRK
jgi:hypothetical protein